jgi:hypothetical protein
MPRTSTGDANGQAYQGLDRNRAYRQLPLEGIRNGDRIAHLRWRALEELGRGHPAIAPARDERPNDHERHLGRPPQPENRLIQVQRVEEVLDDEEAPPQGTRQAEHCDQEPSSNPLPAPHEPVGRECREDHDRDKEE